MIFLKDEKSNINAKFGPVIMIWSVLFIILSGVRITGLTIFSFNFIQQKSPTFISGEMNANGCKYAKAHLIIIF